MKTTPAEISEAILQICHRVSPNHQPAYHRATPRPDSVPLAHEDNCDREISRAGGKIAFGWLVRDLPKNLITLVHHSVVMRDGRVIDPTPSGDDETRVLFLRDDSAVPTGDVIPSHFFQLGDDPEISHLVEDMREIFDLHEDAEAEAEVKALVKAGAGI